MTKQHEPVTTRLATLDDLPFLLDLARRDSEALGLIPRGAYEGAIDSMHIYARPNNRLWIAEANADLVGFLYATPGRLGCSARLVQVCLRRDARRLEYGTALVAEVETYARAIQRTGVGLRVGEDLAATAFWEALDYRLLGTVEGGARRKRILQRRYKPLPGLWDEEPA